MNKPRTLVAALLLILLGVVLSLIAGVVNVIHAPPEFARGAFAVGMLIAVGLQLAFAYAIDRGRNWARYLFVVLLVAGLVMNSGGPNPEVVHHGVVTVNFWLQIVLGAAIAVLLLLPPTHTWFREQKRLRRAAAADTAA